MGLEVMIGASLLATGVGSVTQFAAQREAAQQSRQVAELERQRLEQQKKQMDLQYQRQQMEQWRQIQRTRSASLTTATSQGAQLGSAMQSSFGQIAGQGYNHLLALDQNYTIGNNLYGINQGISNIRMDMADTQSLLSMGQGLSSLGSGLMSAVPAYTRLTGANVNGGNNYWGYRNGFNGVNYG